MPPVRIALAQLDLTIADLDGAVAAIRAAAVEAVRQGAQVLLTPELALVGGYPPRDLLARRWFVERQWALLPGLARDLPLPCLIGAVEPLPADGAGPALANVLAFCERGAVQAVYRKRRLPTYDVFDEARHFRPGDRSCVVEVAGTRLGLTVCEDIWDADFAGIAYAQDPLADLAGRCDLVVNASASPWQQGKPELRRAVFAAAARRTGAAVAWCNQVGGNDELIFDGDAAVVDRAGRCLGAAGRWTAGVAVVDTAAPPVAWPAERDPCDELHAALVLGLRDYCRKTGQRRVVLGISGGIDSALVAALAADALGPDAVTGLLMPGPYSSPGSVSDAAALAANLGIAAHTLPIAGMWDAALATLAPVFAGRPHDVAEENLQSRLRGVLVMATANKLGGMALTTGNKSELACGYCTIYGDMNGGLGPIGDLYKTEVWALSRRINAVAGRERIPTASIDKAPSAELRANQTDQDSLPPYPVLDRILDAWLERDASREDLLAAGEDPATVDRVIRLVEISEFKRRQAPPVLRVSGKAFGMGRRMPIARRI
jgi:NAD+ synthetase